MPTEPSFDSVSMNLFSQIWASTGFKNGSIRARIEWFVKYGGVCEIKCQGNGHGLVGRVGSLKGKVGELVRLSLGTMDCWW